MQKQKSEGEIQFDTNLILTRSKVTFDAPCIQVWMDKKFFDVNIGPVTLALTFPQFIKCNTDIFPTCGFCHSCHKMWVAMETVSKFCQVMDARWQGFGWDMWGA